MFSFSVPPRPAGACARCKRQKMRCEFLSPSADKCKRCISSRSCCIVEGPKPRTPSLYESLNAQLSQKDATIAALLQPYHRAIHATPIVLAASKLPLSPAERASHRGALQCVEKPALRPSRRHPWSVHPKYDDDSDNGSSPESDDSQDPWDADADAAAGPAGPGPVYPNALPGLGVPLGLIARLSLENQDSPSRKRSADAMDADADDDDDQWGIANPAYFHPGPSANLALRRVIHQREMPPLIIASGLITWPEAESLFKLFYDSINPYISVLDPVLHTCSTVFERCPFLFTVVCAISLRYHSPRPGLHKLAMHFSKAAAATAFVDGFKSVELVQAYFLLANYGLPARRWEEDRSWFYGGLATRLAIDLGLHKSSGVTTAPLSERHGRELRNRVRTWLICFNLDRSSATLFGKPSAIHDEEVVRLARGWYGARYCHPYDVHLVVYAELLRIMSRFHAQIRAGGVRNTNCDVRAVTEATEVELAAWRDDAAWRYAHESDANDPGSVLRVKNVPFFENYMLLVMYSFGFQDAWARRGAEPGDMFFAKCLHAASAVLRHIIHVSAPGGYLPYAPDCHFVMAGFCAAFLLKLCRPEFHGLLAEPQRARAAALVGSLVAAFAALSDAHTPRLYARFLGAQLRAVKAPSEAPPGVPPLVAHSSPGSQASSSSSSDGVTEGDVDSEATPRPDAWEGAGMGMGMGTGMGEPEYIGAMGAGMGEPEYLGAMQAVSSEEWLASFLMPGFKWEGGPGVDVWG